MAFPYRLIATIIKSGGKPALIGPTGCGKTEGTKAVLRDWMGIQPEKTIIVRMAQQDPITMGSGVPMKNEDGLTFSSLVQKDLFEVAMDPAGAIFLDELGDADMDQMRSVSPFINELDFAGHSIQAAIIAATNRPQDGANEIDRRLASRLIWLPVKRDRQQFVQGLREGWDKVMGKAPKTPNNWVDLRPKYQAKVADFIDQHKEALPDEDDRIDPNFPAHPNERTWDFGVNLMACAEATKLSRKEIQMGLEGCVGRGLGAQFMMWDRHGGLDVRELISDTSKLKKYLSEAPDTVDSIFEAVGAFTAEGQITGEECGAFYSAALKHGFSPELVLRHLRKISEKLPKAVRDAIANEVAVRYTP